MFASVYGKNCPLVDSFGTITILTSHSNKMHIYAKYLSFFSYFVIGLNKYFR